MKGVKSQNWQKYSISADETHHVFGKEAAYRKRFKQVLKFHAPGIAPVLDASGAYHIDPEGEPIYSKRYTRTFGFYGGLAAVNDGGEWFHVCVDGASLYRTRYLWCGNFQEGCCVVKDQAGRFFHIDNAGFPLYSRSYSYVGDFHDGTAVVQTDQGFHFHIDCAGERLYPQEFVDLDVFHKGYARAKDERGWCHIGRSGLPIYSKRYAMVEPFYNGVARVETTEGALVLIDESGDEIQQLRPAKQDLFHDVSGDLVCYWRLFTLQAANDFKIFDYLPARLETISTKSGLDHCMAEKILLALKEMNYVIEADSIWMPTQYGEFFLPSHPYSLKDAQQLWMMEHFHCWHHLSFSLQNRQCAFDHLYKMSWFDFLDTDHQKQEQYHQALSRYARRDYGEIAEKVDFSKHRSIADIGGSTGALLQILLKKTPNLFLHLLDLPSVVGHLTLDSICKERVKVHPIHFFKPWPEIAVDAAILCRVIHDWADAEALHILKEARALLRGPSSRLYIVENILDKKTGKGALLNLNMHVMTGGKERTFDEFYLLCSEAGFAYDSVVPLNNVSSILIFKPLNEANIPS